ncbi:MAG: hypothetical protein Q8L14_41740 [Myxococcales bacterium]|nr:hypothetical protein [Myxococcales bacterium]
MSRAIIGALVLSLSSPAWGADWCPPSANDFTSWGARDAVTTGDVWMSGVWCGASVNGVLVPLPSREPVINSFIDAMGLGQNWGSRWAALMSNVTSCDPESWSGRFANGAYFADYLGYHREQTSFVQSGSPWAVMPEGDIVKYWLARYIKYYTREDGWAPFCIATGDVPNDNRFTNAANPDNHDPLRVYFPWFWVLSTVDRSSVLVHEATHQFSSHIGDGECANQGSCDPVFGSGNAQTLTIIFAAQAMDAYRRAPDSSQLEVYNYGQDFCGYVPLIPDAQRFALVQSMQLRLMNTFKYPPPQSEWPPSAFIDFVWGTGLDFGDNAGGASGSAYRIDLVNGSRWPCGAVCTLADYDFATGGTRACNENYQAGNVAINQQNKALCLALNTQVAGGVTQTQHALLRNKVTSEAKPCLAGVSDAWVAQVCSQLSSQATKVEDLETNWSIPDMEFHFDASRAIHACQASFCAQKHTTAWDTAASAACFDWDDPYGCLKLACGDLAALQNQYGKSSPEYLKAVVCRSSELNRDFAGLADPTSACSEKYTACLLEERYQAAWAAQQAGGACWVRGSGSSPTTDPLFVTLRDKAGTVAVENFLALDTVSHLATSRCLMENVTCQMEAAALDAALAKLIHDEAKTRPVWKVPTLPDSWEKLKGRYDRDVFNEMDRIGAALTDPTVTFGPLSKNPALARLVASPEASLAIAAVVGQDTYLKAGGSRFAKGIFNPAVLTRYGTEADPYGFSTAAHTAELSALGRLNQRLSATQVETAFSKTNRLTAPQAYGHVLALFNAKNGVELEAAFEAFVADAAAR